MTTTSNKMATTTSRMTLNTFIGGPRGRRLWDCPQAGSRQSGWDHQAPCTRDALQVRASLNVTRPLEAGDSHEFEIPYPLTYRRKTDKGLEVYTLPAGSHSEFRIPLSGEAPRLFAANRPVPSP